MIRLGAKDTKEAMPKSVPLSKTVRELLLTLPEMGKSGPVFTYKGNPSAGHPRGP
jgi:hypothetical protein